MGDDAPTPAADAVAFNAQFVTRVDGFILQVRATLSLPLDNVSDDALAQAVVGYQQTNGLNDVDGKLNGETIDRLRNVDRIGQAEWAAMLDARDAAAVQAVVDDIAGLRSDPDVTPDRLRDGILRVAASQIGTVNAANRGDGKMYGARRVVQYFSIVAGDVPENEITAAGMPTHNWCGIFAVWATNAAAGKGWWGLGDDQIWGPLGLDKVAASDDPTLSGLMPGDIVAIPEFQHQFLFVERDGDDLLSIDGNGDWQVVHRARHPASAVVAYFPVVR